MSLYAEWYSDWAHPYPFRVLNLQSEHDPQLGQWCVQVALLGIAVEFTWVYDPDTQLRAELAEMMADDSWLQTSKAWVPYPEYQELLAAKDELAKLKAERGE